MRLKGKVALVTGAGGGLGTAIAKRFASEGAALMCADRDGARAQATASAITKSGGSAQAFQADVAAKQAQVAQLEATLVNARLTTERARTLLGGPAGLQSNYDAAVANQRVLREVRREIGLQFTRLGPDENRTYAARAAGDHHGAHAALTRREGDFARRRLRLGRPGSGAGCRRRSR